MTVIFYDDGEHNAGFVGFRAVRTVGRDNDYRQAYFSLNIYSYAEAHKLAHALDRKWEAEAAKVKLADRVRKRRASAGPNIIATGFRATILVENKIRGGVKRTYFAPSFVVGNPGYGKGETVYRVSNLGYEKSFNLALAKYCEIHNLPDTDYSDLLEQMPCETIFSEYLLGLLHDRGYSISRDEVLEKLI